MGDYNELVMVEYSARLVALWLMSEVEPITREHV